MLDSMEARAGSAHKCHPTRECEQIARHPRSSIVPQPEPGDYHRRGVLAGDDTLRG